LRYGGQLSGAVNLDARVIAPGSSQNISLGEPPARGRHLNLLNLHSCRPNFVRIVKPAVPELYQDLTASDRSLDRLSDNVSSGFGVRAIKDGAWEFAASPSQTPAEFAIIVAKAIEIAKGSRLS